jgi:hypothetical protein
LDSCHHIPGRITGISFWKFCEYIRLFVDIDSYTFLILFHTGSDNYSDIGYYGGVGDIFGGQSFTPSISHYVDTVRLKLFKHGVPVDPLVVEIYATDEGLPVGDPLTGSEIDPTTLTSSDSGDWYDFVLSDLVYLDSSTVYSIVVSSSDSSYPSNDPNWNRDYQGASYSGGVSLSGVDGAWTVYDTGTDFMFEEWGCLEIEEPPVVENVEFAKFLMIIFAICISCYIIYKYGGRAIDYFVSRVFKY